MGAGVLGGLDCTGVLGGGLLLAGAGDPGRGLEVVGPGLAGGGPGVEV